MNKKFPGSEIYWENRYRKNGNSGNGSYGIKAEYKAAIINRFVAERNIVTVIELGCGDGNQLMQFHFENYIGFDVSPTAIKKCNHIFKDDVFKKFFLYQQETPLENSTAELTLSLDVIYHLIEQDVFEKYIRNLFSMARKYVIIYAWDVESDKNYHVKHRKFSEWIKDNVSDFKLYNKIKNSTFSDFYIYQRIEHA